MKNILAKVVWFIATLFIIISSVLAYICLADELIGFTRNISSLLLGIFCISCGYISAMCVVEKFGIIEKLQD